MTDADTENAKPRPEPTIEITVDSEPVTMHTKKATPNDIMTEAGIDPATHYLVELKKHQQKSYEGLGDTEIHLKDGLVFIANSTGPTPLS